MMQTHTMSLYDGPFQRIARGEKLLECRLYDDKRKLIQIGDKIVFINKEKSELELGAIVQGLLLYPSFNDLFRDTHRQFFSQYSREELQDCMLEYYSAEDERSYGVVGIRFVVIK